MVGARIGATAATTLGARSGCTDVSGFHCWDSARDRKSHQNTHGILLRFFQLIDRLIKVSSLRPSLAVILIVTLQKCLARCMKQRPCIGPNVVGLGSTYSHVWLEPITVFPLAVRCTDPGPLFWSGGFRIRSRQRRNKRSPTAIR